MASVAKQAEVALTATSEADTSLRALIDAHFDFVFRSLRRLGVDDAFVDDAVQEVWLVITRKGEPVRPESARALLFAIALRVAADARRATRRRRQVSDDRAIDRAPDRAPLPDENFARARARAMLDEILDELPEELRAVFVLFELEQMGSPEIAQALGIPVGTVASRLRRARESFQAMVRRRAARQGGAR